MMGAMDRIPIGGTPPDPDDGEHDNVVRLPSVQASDEVVGIPVESHQVDDAAVDDEPEMSWEEAVAADAEADVPEDPPPVVPGAGMATLLEQGMRVGAGMVSAGASAVADALRSTMPESADEEGEDPAATMAGAGLGAAITAAEAAAAAAKSAAEAVGPIMSWVTNPAALQGASETAAGAARLLDGQWKATQAETAQAATAFLTVLIPEITTAILDQIDLTQIVKERVDINAIVEDVDMDRIVDRLDIAAIVDRVDVNAVVQRVDMGQIVEDLPIEKVVDRVDVNEIVERVDIRGVIDRLDLAEITQDVMDDIDLPSIIRESSGAMASETVQTVRVRGMDADGLVSKIVDRMLRREQRQLEAPGEPKDD
jgi:hypothetical protein